MDKMKVRPVTATTTVETRKNSQTQEIEIPTNIDFDMVKEMVQLDVELGLTKNLGNFESARITVRVSRPSTEALLDVDFEKTRNWIEKKIATEIDSINQAKNAMTNSMDFDN